MVTSRRGMTGAEDLTGYVPLTSRDGLVLLGRMCWIRRQHDLCVYDPISGGACTFLPGLPDQSRHSDARYYKHVLLTPAADGVLTARFVVLTFDFVALVKGLRSITVRTLSSSSSSSEEEDDSTSKWAWSTATVAITPSRPSRFPNQMPTGNAVTVRGVVHWLLRQVYDDDCCIFTYNAVTHAPDGWIEVPPECRASSQLHLASSPPSTNNNDGMSSSGRLSLIMEAADHRSISFWVLLQSSSSGSSSSSWTRRASVALQLPLVYRERDTIGSVVSAPRSGTVMLLPYSGYLHHWQSDQGSVVVLDLETMEMRTVNKDKQAFLYEVDLLSRMRTF
ncbi:hypothetical protein PR202_gb24345 [Eleusine coracana subsp. coracana]|uniref:DUF7595 domain-containing protein n=1 Tax=Eleusine coracana subsp. coracana TaxID=191504 RepID=A0AAV5FLA0_ELECO|nr:hypothetical protein PR202_gb24345 [Eleusine coracana subsp. coracana]